MLTANRRNALKSTGARTLQGRAHSARNRLKRGRYARNFSPSREVLEDEAREFQALERDFARDWRPADASERALVRRLASLVRKQERIERAQAGLAAAQVEAFEIDRARRRRRDTREMFDSPAAALLHFGLCRSKNHPDRFEEILNYLRVLLGEAQNRRFAEDPESVLVLLYGENPT